jgi:peptidoglycan hydrolase-like protein with peptidoglycan-binding domain
MEKSDTIIPIQSTSKFTKNINKIKKFSQNTYIRNTFFIFGLSVLALCYFTVFNKGQAAVDYPFYRYLSIGSKGDDVRILQQVLNTDPRTQVSRSGAGSPGRETNVYGGLTRQAVIKFQQLNSDTVRQDGAGVFYSGALDDLTRRKLNNYTESIGFMTNRNSGNIQSQAINIPIADEQDQINANYRAAVTVIPGFPFIDSITPKKVDNGELITIRGRNFSTTTANIIRLTYNEILATSTDGVTLRIPANSELNKKFNEEVKDLSEDGRNRARQRAGEFIHYITVQNNVGVSNAQMIYIRLK